MKYKKVSIGWVYNIFVLSMLFGVVISLLRYERGQIEMDERDKIQIEYFERGFRQACELINAHIRSSVGCCNDYHVNINNYIRELEANSQKGSRDEIN